MESAQQLLRRIQSVLSFEGFPYDSQFRSDKSLGRVATTATILGALWGAHLSFGVVLVLHPSQWLEDTIGKARVMLLTQWCAYIVLLCTFHSLEFFTTAIYNPTVTTAESFLMNHSLGYTAAFLTSSMEFWLGFLVFPGVRSTATFLFGLGLVVLAQILRSLAMATCGESFNHRIQTTKKQNHVLITHGVYSILRHPSYVGFFYWSVGTQILLNNFLHTFLFAAASSLFFRKRIPYEEESLFQYFPDTYPAYRAKTYIGIPFVPTVPLSPYTTTTATTTTTTTITSTSPSNSTNDTSALTAHANDKGLKES